MSPLQIIILFFVLFALWRTIKRYREGGFALAWLVAWLLVWIAIGVATSLPQTTTLLARIIGVGRGVDAVIYLAIIGLYYMVFRVFLRLEKLEHDISSLVRHLSLKDGGVVHDEHREP